MKTIILTLAIGLSLLTFTSCKKDNPKPSTSIKSIVDLETRFVTESGVAEDTYYVLQFGTESENTENWAQQLFVNECGEVGVNTHFDSQDTRRVEIYKNGDNNSNFVWMGEISVNSIDSTFIINEIYGPNVDLNVIECDNLMRLQIQE